MTILYNIFIKYYICKNELFNFIIYYRKNDAYVIKIKGNFLWQIRMNKLKICKSFFFQIYFSFTSCCHNIYFYHGFKNRTGLDNPTDSTAGRP